MKKRVKEKLALREVSNKEKENPNNKNTNEVIEEEEDNEDECYETKIVEIEPHLSYINNEYRKEFLSFDPASIENEKVEEEDDTPLYVKATNREEAQVCMREGLCREATVDEKSEIGYEGFYDGTEKNEKASFNDSFKMVNEKRPGKIDKTRVFTFILIFFALIIALITFTDYRGKEKDKKVFEKEEKTVVDDSYYFDAGNYKARAHKASKQEEEIKNLKETEEGISTYENQWKKEEKPKTSSTSTSRPSSSSSSSSNKNVTDAEDKGVISSLRYSGEGFGYKSNEYVASSSNSSNEGVPYSRYGEIPTEEEIEQRYIARAKSVNNAFSEGSKDDTRYSDAGRYDPSINGGDIKPIPNFSLYPGTVINAVLVNGINTDYPGTITARVTSNVYDSETGQVLLIPTGSVLRGRYSSSSAGVSRIQIGWETLIISRDYEDYIVNLGSMVGTDSSGYSGQKGAMNDHPIEKIKATAVSALFTVINHNIYSSIKNTKNTLKKELLGLSQETGNDVSEKIIDRALDIQPTVTVKPGTRINVDVDKTLTLIPYRRDKN